MHNLLIPILVVIVIILIYTASTSRANTLNNYISGAWIANDQFCEEAEVETLMIVFGEPIPGYFGKVERMGHIVATPDMINTGFKLKYSRGYTLSSTEYIITARVEFEEEPLWDENVTIKINVMEGRMRIYSGDTLYADMFKSHDITDTIKDIEVVD